MAKVESDSFDDLNLNQDLLKGVYLYGFNQPSKIQIKGISSINTGKDCILQSQSGTGKTATYLLGVMNRLEENKTLQGIVIAPTRELAEQIYSVAMSLSEHTKFKIVKCTGGTSVYQTIQDMKGANMIIGTMGRINHMIEDNKINSHGIKFIVMDEADELFVKGITRDMYSIFDKLPSGIQVVFISATMNSTVFDASKKFAHDPIKVLLKQSEVVVDLISQFYIDIEKEDLKFDTLLDLYNLISASQAIIFCNTIKKVQWLEENLKKNNFPITSMHSDMDQAQRDATVKEFRDGKTRLLLTTDILARGIDIPQVNMVINYDLPPTKETYIHRIGRCGRFDKKGVAITMIKSLDQSDVKTFHKMKNFYRIKIDEMPEDIKPYL